MELEIKTADQLTDPALEARWAARRAGRHREIFQRVLRTFVARPGTVPVADVTAAFPDRPAGAIREAVAQLDREDLLLLRGDRIELAYPISGVPTPFTVGLPDGSERYACCAIDALGMAPMLDARIVIRARCHHAGGPLAFAVGPSGPEGDGDGIMVWVAARDPAARRIVTSL